MKKFIEAQKRDYDIAFEEIKNGRKMNHWIWYIFPQIIGLGKTYISQYYAIKSLDEAKDYLDNDYLRENLFKITRELLLRHNNKNIVDIMNIDTMKLLSCMTLFKIADNDNICKGIFQNVIDKFYNGKPDQLTINILRKQEKKN